MVCDIFSGSERDMVCCGKRNSSRGGVSFNSRHGNLTLGAFWVHSVAINALFAFVRLIMDLQFVRGGRPSFPKLYGIFPLLIRMKDSRYFFLWLESELGFRLTAQRSRLLADEVQDHNVEYKVPIHYGHLKPPPNIIFYWYKKCSALRDL